MSALSLIRANLGSRRSACWFVIAFATVAQVIAEPVFMPFTNTPSITSESLPASARISYNLGTRKLHEGKLRESESLLQNALEKQDEKVQAPALYNLGEVRFAQGVDELKKSPAGKPTAARGWAAAEGADAATIRAREALVENDLQKMTAAYLNGRGARKELKSAMQAVQRALEQHGATLRKWQRSLDDFKSAAELNPKDTHAQHNAEIVQKAIAKLVDSIREMQQAAKKMAASGQELHKQMKQLGGKIPEPMMPPGAKGEDEEDDEGENGKEAPPEPQAGMQEKPGKEGEEMRMSPKEAGWLLEGFKLDGDRRLPMGKGDGGKPKDRNTRNW
jgi:tetratricopeptide (TPR) repeat protein